MTSFDGEILGRPPFRPRARAALSPAWVRSRIISTSPRSLSFSEAVRPPVEEGGGADPLRLVLERGAAGQLGLFELLDGREMAVHEHGVGERPQVFGGLEFGGIGWEEEQVDMVGYAQAL